MPLLQEIGSYLAAQGIGTLGTDLFLGVMEDQPDICTALYESGGQAPIRAMRGTPGQVVQRPRLQVVCRATQLNYLTARDQAGAIYRLLDGLGDTVMSTSTGSSGGTRYLFIAAVAEPFLMGRDLTSRVLVAANYDVVKDPS